MLEAELGRIHAELLGDLVEVDLEGKARLRSAVAALGPAGRLVRERPCPLEPVTGNVIRDGLQRPRVIGARDPVGPVAAAVEQRLEVHAGDGAVPFHARLHPHERGVAPAVAVEHLFARKGGFYGSPRDHSQLRDYDLMTEGIALPAEAAPVRARDHADARTGAASAGRAIPSVMRS